MESTLALKKADFESEVGLFLGYGPGVNRGESAWTTSQTAVIESCVKSGLRQFYFPPPMKNIPPHKWTFLTPPLSIALASGDRVAELPDDFGAMSGPIIYVSDSSGGMTQIPIGNEGGVQQRFNLAPDATGAPLYAAIRPLTEISQLAGQRFELAVYPEADAVYTLSGTYHLLPDCLTGGKPFCYGGAAHAETILESCLAIAEQRLDDTSAVHSAKFQERLAASIGYDLALKPKMGGYVGDGHTGMANGRFYPRVYVNGVAY